MQGEELANPGSDAAKRRGCTCPVIDNHYGRGWPHKGHTAFYIAEGCPLHDATTSDRSTFTPTPDTSHA